MQFYWKYCSIGQYIQLTSILSAIFPVNLHTFKNTSIRYQNHARTKICPLDDLKSCYVKFRLIFSLMDFQQWQASWMESRSIPASYTTTLKWNERNANKIKTNCEIGKIRRKMLHDQNISHSVKNTQWDRPDSRVCHT